MSTQKLTLKTSTYERRVGFMTALSREERNFADLVTDMRCGSKRVSLSIMRRHCANINEWAKDHGYAIGREKGLHLKDDWAVRFYRSFFRSKTCYYIDWSGHQFIWC